MREPPRGEPGEPPAPSATTVLLRPGRSAPLEVLLVRRNAALQFYGGAWVFPGGRVDARELAAGSSDVEAARLAATREVAEETALTIDPEALTPLARWTTPVNRPRRYRAWFFLATADDPAPVRVDGGEILEHRWAEPGAMLEARQRGELVLPPPVFVTLSELAGARSMDEALAASRAGPRLYDPRVAEVSGGRVSLYQGDAGFDRVDADAPGERHRLWMVGPRWRYQREP